jgi:FkbM family methyltransferase
LKKAESIKRVLRSLQTYTPGIRPAKFAFYNWMTQKFGRKIDPDFLTLSRLGTAELAIDIGGNWGQSIYALKRVLNPARIISFEPNPALSKRLREEFANDSSVEIEAVGLGDVAGEFSLFVPTYRGFEYDGLASLNEDEAREWLNPKRMAAFNPAKLKIDSHRVAVKTLDSYRLSPDVIKIDVQGLEFQVVTGAQETIRRSYPVTIVEAPSTELVELFRSLNMVGHRWDGTTLKIGDTTGKNVIFMTEERRSSMGF